MTENETKNNPKENISTENIPSSAEPPKKAPEWWTNIKNFLTTIFWTPIAILHRIGTRLGLGPDGAKRADQLAELEAKKHATQRDAKKQAAAKNEEINELIQFDARSPEHTESPFAFKSCNVSVSDSNNENYIYTVTVTCQNDTRFSVFIDSNDRIICNSLVPDEVASRINEYWQKTIHKERTFFDEDTRERETQPEDAPAPPVEPPRSEKPSNETSMSFATMKEFNVQDNDGKMKHLVEVRLNGRDTPQVLADITDMKTTRKAILKMDDGSLFNCSMEVSGAIKVTLASGLESNPSWKLEQQALLAKAVLSIFKDVLPNREIEHGTLMETVAQTMKEDSSSISFYIAPTKENGDTIIELRPSHKGTVYAHVSCLYDDGGRFKFSKPNAQNESIICQPGSRTDQLARQLIGAYTEASPIQSNTFFLGSQGMYCVEQKNNQARVSVFTTPSNAQNTKGVILIRSDSPISDDIMLAACNANSDVLETAPTKPEMAEKEIQVMADYLRTANPQEHACVVIGDIQCTLQHDDDGPYVVANFIGKDFLGNGKPAKGPYPIDDSREDIDGYKEALSRAISELDATRDEQTKTILSDDARDEDLSERE